MQSSNFAAEFGQVGGGLFNFTMKSGSSQYHGSTYDYFVNEFRGPATFVVLRYGLPVDALANLGFKMKPYRTQEGRALVSAGLQTPPPRPTPISSPVRCIRTPAAESSERSPVR